MEKFSVVSRPTDPAGPRETTSRLQASLLCSIDSPQNHFCAKIIAFTFTLSIQATNNKRLPKSPPQPPRPHLITYDGLE